MFYMDQMDFIQRIVSAGFASMFIILLLGVMGLASLVAVCVFRARALNNIGEKLGSERSWMVYVPVANTLYYLRIAGCPWWYAFLTGQSGVIVSFVLGRICGLTSGALNVMSGLAIVAYLIVNLIFTIKTHLSYYNALGMSPMLALPRTFPLVSIISDIVDLLIAYTPLFDEKVSHGSPLPAHPGAEGHIQGISGMYGSAVFTVAEGQKLVFGRDSACSNVVFDQFDTDISRQHCTVEYVGGTYFVTDTSKNGTFTSDGTRLAAGVRTSLPQGTIIYLGNNKNTFRLE